MLHVHVQGRGGDHTPNHGLTADCLYNVHVAVFLKVTGSLHADTRAVYLIKRYFIVFCRQK